MTRLRPVRLCATCVDDGRFIFATGECGACYVDRRLRVVDGVGPHPSATGTGDAGRVPDRVTGPGNGPEAA